MGNREAQDTMLKVGGECPGPPFRKDCSLQIRVSHLTQRSAMFSHRDARWRCGTAMGTLAGPRGLPGGSGLGTLPGQTSAGLLAPSSKFVIFPRDKEHPFTCCLILPSPLRGGQQTNNSSLLLGRRQVCPSIRGGGYKKIPLGERVA